MGDATSVANLPLGLDAYAGYVDGRYQNTAAIAQRFPNTPLLTITTSPTSHHPADVADLECGDWSIAQAPQALAQGCWCLYTSVSNVGDLLRVVPRSAFKLWTAHYTNTPHLCSPACTPGLPTTADATQWTDHGGAWDESLLADDFLPPWHPKKGTDDMPAVVIAPTGKVVVAAASPDNHLLVFVGPSAEQGAVGHWSVEDVTDQIQVEAPGSDYTIAG